MSELKKPLILPSAIRLVAPFCASNEDGPFADDGGDARCQTHCVKITQDGNQFKAISTDGRFAAILTAPAITVDEKKFPNIEAVIPTSKPVATVIVHGERLASLLMSAQEAAGYSGSVRLELREGNQPIVVVGENEHLGIKFQGLLVPMEKRD